MTVLACAYCGDRFQRPSTRGPAPKYCSHACRQRAYEARNPRLTRAEWEATKIKMKPCPCELCGRGDWTGHPWVPVDAAVGKNQR